MEKPPCVELGTPMNWCAIALKAQHVDGKMVLPDFWWRGWKIHQHKLIGPGGMTFTAASLARISRNVRAAALAGD